MAEHLLSVHDLAVSFLVRKKWITAVSDISFYVDKGETLGIVGESGCGKSVTSLSILHLLPKTTSRIDRGSIVFEGTEISHFDDKQMSRIRGKQIAMIFQDSMTSLNPVMTIGVQLMEALKVHQKLSHEEMHQRVITILENVGMPSPEKRFDEYPHQLSGGMRQRVMIAMALIQSPDLLIADEPTTALDVTIQAQILGIMKDLKKNSDISIMLITHDMGVVAEMTDRIMVMYAGNIMEMGCSKDIFHNPLHPYTQGLLASIPRSDKDIVRLTSIEGTVPTLMSMPKGCHFCTRCKYSMAQCVTERPPLFLVGAQLVACWRYAHQEERLT